MRPCCDVLCGRVELCGPHVAVCVCVCVAVCVCVCVCVCVLMWLCTRSKPPHWLQDRDLLNGSTGYCTTFDSPSLVTGPAPDGAPSKKSVASEFQCADVEVWGLKDAFSGKFR